MSVVNWGAAGLGRYAQTTPDWAAYTVKPRGRYCVKTWTTTTVTASDFPATSDYYQATLNGKMLDPLLASNWTIAFWVQHTVNPWTATGSGSQYGVLGFFDPAIGDAIMFTMKYSSAAGCHYVMTVDNGPTVSTGTGPAGEIAPNLWNHVILTCDGGLTTMYLNGVSQGTVPPSAAAGVTTMGMFINRPGLLVANEFTCVNVKMDDLQFFNGTHTDPAGALLLYNNGLPRTNSVIKQDVTVTAWYPVDQATGSVSATNLRCGKGQGATISWSVSWLSGNAPVIDTSPPAATAESQYTLQAQQALLWNDGTGILIDSNPYTRRYALGASVRTDTVAPALLPYPQPGWGFDTTSYGTSVFGSLDRPLATPLLTVSTTALQDDPTTNPVVGGVGSLQYVVDRRPVYVRKPSFVK